MVVIGGIQKTTLIDYPGRIASTVFLAGCNMRCVFCHNPSIVNGTKNYSEEQFFSFLMKQKRNIDGVVVSGGEPTIHADLPAFLQKIKQEGLLVKLDTNGTNPEMLKKLIGEKLVDYIAMDMKAPYEKYTMVTNAKKVVNSIKKSVRAIMESDVDHEFRTTCFPAMKKEDFKKIAGQIRGAKKYFLQVYRDEITIGPQKHLSGYTKKDLEKIMQEISPNFKLTGVRG